MNLDKKVIGKCALCQQLKELRKSHIIPDFQYKPLYDKKHRLYKGSTDPLDKGKALQSGIWERLLCNECEQHFATWERYASQVLFEGCTNVNVQKGVLDEYEIVSGIQYETFKLFLMSLLWRMGVAKGPTWKEVILGPHEGRLRKLLLASDPAEVESYPCIMTAIKIDGVFSDQWIYGPSSFRFGGHQAYRIVIHGFLFTFVVSLHRLPFDIGQVSLNKAGEMRVYIRESSTIPHVHPFFDAVRASSNKF